MPEDINGAEAVGIVTIDWRNKSIEMEGIGGSDQMTPADVMARIAEPTDPDVEVHVMVLWDAGSNGHGKLWQLCWYDADDVCDGEPEDSDDEGDALSEPPPLSTACGKEDLK